MFRHPDRGGDTHVKIVSVQNGSVAAALGITAGDELLEINGERVRDGIDVRFHEADPEMSLKIARDGDVLTYRIENNDGDRLGIEIEEMTTLSCGNDCIFCFVDQNPGGLRKGLYFRDGDYRLSFMYGNYTTMTNAGPAILRRIIEQRLSPQYISVHVTDLEIRKKLMGLKKDDRILEKIRLLNDNGIDMHTQIVLCPGINDGATLERTVHDLYGFREHVVSLAVVPVGLTDHRFGLASLQKAGPEYAREIIATVGGWGKKFRKEIGRGFVYPSDEFYILAGKAVPGAQYYDGFPQIENGVGLVRSFLTDFRRQMRTAPRRLPVSRRLTLATGELADGILRAEVLPLLSKIGNLDVRVEVIPNLLYGRSVTVAGLLSGNCLYSALHGKDCGDLLLLPPDIVNGDGLFLDDMTLPALEERLGAPVMIFTGRWKEVFSRLILPDKRSAPHTLVPSRSSNKPTPHP